MNRKYISLLCMLAVSGIVVGVVGTVLKYAVLEPMGLHRQENVVALPFVFFRDEGLRYVVADLKGSEPTEPATLPQAPEQSETAPTELKPSRRMLFIGDSRTCALRDQSRLEDADYFCDVGMNVFNAPKKQLSDESFKGEGLYNLLSKREYGYVVIGLGLNEAGYPIESLLKAYQELVTYVVRTQPQAVIVLQGVMAVSRSWVDNAPHTAPENLRKINEGIRSLAGRYRVCYLDANERFADEMGFLPDDMTADGCHLYAKYTRLWSQWLFDEINKL